MKDLENQLGIKTQQILFWVWKPKKDRYTKFWSVTDRIEDISQKMLKNSRDCWSFGWIRGPTSLRT